MKRCCEKIIFSNCCKILALSWFTSIAETSYLEPSQVEEVVTQEFSMESSAEGAWDQL